MLDRMLATLDYGSADRNNLYSPTLNVIPIASKLRKKKLPIHVELLEYRQYGGGYEY